MKFTKPVCSTCGSDDVRLDAHAGWDPTTQEHFVITVFDKGHSCEKCGGECSIVDKPLEGDELENARAYKLAKDDGWEEGDEDTAIEYCDTESLDYTKPIPGEVTP